MALRTRLDGLRGVGTTEILDRQLGQQDATPIEILQRQPSSRFLIRKKDIFHVTFLAAITFLAFAIDFVPYYPVKFPHWTKSVYTLYREQLNDPLYVRDPPFFQFYVFFEAVYAVPTCVHCIRGLIRADDRMVPVHALIFATHLTISTVICLVEVLCDEDWPREIIIKNVPGYILFFAAAAFLWIDMFARVRASVLAKDKAS